MTNFSNEVSRIEKQIEQTGYDKKAEKEFLKRWSKLPKS